MKPFTAILCICALAMNSALGSIGGMVICIEKDIEEPRHRILATLDDTEGACCPSELSHPTKELRFLIDCHFCVDLVLETADLENAKLSSDRIAAKALPVLELGFINPAGKIGEQWSGLKQSTARIPLIPLGAVTEYAATIQFRC
ncbi:MAG: hypothetical protein KJT03_05450 [Verrucomicrobiae bacterium]|nr:hypothetical protein [Verrucomicrobiae bacterium]